MARRGKAALVEAAVLPFIIMVWLLATAGCALMLIVKRIYGHDPKSVSTMAAASPLAEPAMAQLAAPLKTPMRSLYPPPK